MILEICLVRGKIFVEQTRLVVDILPVLLLAIFESLLSSDPLSTNFGQLASAL